jgi:hypothetical protein
MHCILEVQTVYKCREDQMAYIFRTTLRPVLVLSLWKGRLHITAIDWSATLLMFSIWRPKDVACQICIPLLNIGCVMKPATASILNFKTQSYVHLRSLNFNIYYIFQQPCTWFLHTVYRHMASDSYNSVSFSALSSTYIWK